MMEAVFARLEEGDAFLNVEQFLSALAGGAQVTAMGEGRKGVRGHPETPALRWGLQRGVLPSA